jgi:hypothetical protein
VPSLLLIKWPGLKSFTESILPPGVSTIALEERHLLCFVDEDFLIKRMEHLMRRYLDQRLTVRCGIFTQIADFVSPLL